jgi:hypothetical protein
MPDNTTTPEAGLTREQEQEQAARVDAARTLLEEDRKHRQAACLAAIEEACARYGMTLHIEPARLTLVPRD